MNLNQHMGKLEQHRGGGWFIYLATYPNETVEAALARKGIVPCNADYILVHAGVEKNRYPPYPLRWQSEREPQDPPQTLRMPNRTGLDPVRLAERRGNKRGRSSPVGAFAPLHGIGGLHLLGIRELRTWAQLRGGSKNWKIGVGKLSSFAP